MVQIDVGKYLWKGINESVRVGWKIRLNIDMANKPAYMEEKLVEFIGNFLHSKMRDGCATMEKMVMLLSKDRDAIEKSNREIRDLKVKFERPDGAKRDYRMNKLVKNAHDQIVTMDDRSKVIENIRLGVYIWIGRCVNNTEYNYYLGRLQNILFCTY